MSQYRKVCLVGLDGVVGSFALGLRRTGFRGLIIAVAPTETIEQAWKLGMLSDGTQRVEDGVVGADLVMLSRESAGGGLLADVLAAADDGATISEMTRVKQEVQRVFGQSARSDLHYVGFRLIGDTQRHHDLQQAGKFYFENKTIILTPRGKEDLDAYSQLSDMLRKMGSTVVAMSPQTHDQLVAQLAHVPRITALATLQRLFDPQANYRLTPAMLGDWLVEQARMLSEDGDWIVEIADNRDSVLEGIDAIISTLHELRRNVAEDRLAQSAKALQALTGKALGTSETPKEFGLVITTGEDTKVLETTSRLLAKARIKIKDLDPMRFAEAGTFRLTLMNAEDRDGAMDLLKRSGIEAETIG